MQARTANVLEVPEVISTELRCCNVSYT